MQHQGNLCIKRTEKSKYEITSNSICIYTFGIQYQDGFNSTLWALKCGEKDIQASKTSCNNFKALTKKKS